MSDKPTPAKPPDPDNPYNIDYARERRLTRMFQISIGVGFIIAAILLVIAFAMDALIASKTPDIVPVKIYSTPAESAKSR
jgi:hypothetical protein